MILIKDLLLDMEDKYQNFTTTSKKFKEDLWSVLHSHPNLCNLDRNVAVEFGTHKGQTTRILAHLFKKVYTINLPDHFDSAMHLNSDIDNITYIGLDLYNSDVYEPLIDDVPINLFFIDAVHTYDAVMTDFVRCLNIGEYHIDSVFVFDDYGCWPDVRRAVDELISNEQLEFISHIGHAPGHDFGQGRVLSDWEGIICKLRVPK